MKTYRLSLIILVIFFATGFIFMSYSGKNENYSIKSIQGSALVYNGIPFTLNLKQQSYLLDALNGAKILSAANQSTHLPYQEVIFFSYDGESQKLKVIGYLNDQIIFQKDTIFLQEQSAGKLLSILQTAFEPN